ncbi:MAG: molybdopterin-dependent oxidoreductase, partial [Dehalococcoidia bacterium]
MLRDSFRTLVIMTGRNRGILRGLYYLWRSLPYPLRRVATALFIITVLQQKKLFRVDRQNSLTPLHQLGTLAFWGVPAMDLQDFRLRIEGAVTNPTSFTFDDLKSLPAVRREVRMDCVGGFRNNSIMEGVPLGAVLESLGVATEARRAVFHCADGYDVALDLADLQEQEAFLAYSVNDQAIPEMGYPLRLAVPGKYG